MESWMQVIVEWANCLGFAKKPISDLRDLQDSFFYRELLTKLSQKDNDAEAPLSPSENATATSEKCQELSQFIKAEYPEFTVENDAATMIEPSHAVCIASLLLLHCAQDPAFHRPMCTNLKHETQIQIKHFLELVLPYGNKITREIIVTAIAELRDETQNLIPTTPKYRPLRAFFNSPAARSAQSQRYANDRNRELLRLKAELETEKFEKADLYDDIKIYTEKINNLQRKLNEKSLELKTLKDGELNEFSASATPVKKKLCNCEERYKREFSRLQNVNRDLETKYDELRADYDDREKILLSNERIRVSFEEKLEELEKIIETTSLQLEERNNEILALRKSNDELRLHINEVQRSLMNDQSFEVENVNYAHLSTSLNTSETMSSIIDLQYREAREEIVILRKEAETVKERLDNVTRECDSVKSLNNVLRQKIADAEIVETKLQSLEVVLGKKNDRINILEKSNTDFTTRLMNIHHALETAETTLINERKCRETLEIDFSNQRKKNEELENEIVSLRKNLDDTKIISESREQNLQAKITDLERFIECNKVEVVELKKMLDESKISLCSKEKLLDEAETFRQRIETELMIEMRNIEATNDTVQNEVSQVKENYVAVIAQLSKMEMLLNEVENEKKVAETELTEKTIKFELEIGKMSENLCRSMKTNEELVETKSNLLEANKNLKEELSKASEILDSLNSEKILLIDERMSLLHSNKDLTNQIVSLQSEIKKYCKKIEDECELTSKLEKNEVELKKYIEELKMEIKLETEKLATLSEEKCSLSDQLIAVEQNKASLIEETKLLRDKLEILIEERERSELKLKKLIDEQINKLAALENELEHEKQEKERIIEENTIKTQNLVTNLEHRLSESEKTCAQAIIDEKTKSDELRVAEMKIERLTIERNDFERRNIEIVTNLRELRISQEGAMQAVVKALKDKSEQLEKSQENVLQLEKFVKTKDDEILAIKSQLVDVEAEMSKLQLENVDQNKFATELREQLEFEKLESKKSLESLEVRKNELKNVETLSNGLENQLVALWDIVKRVCPELAPVKKEKLTESDENKENSQISDISLIFQHFTENITQIIKTMSIIIEANETLKDSVENYKKIAENSSIQLQESKNNFDSKMDTIQKQKTQQEFYLISTLKEIRDIEVSLMKVCSQRTETNKNIESTTEKWKNVDNEAKLFLNVENSTGNSVCDELKHLQTSKIEIDDSLRKFNAKRNRETNLLIKTTCRAFSTLSSQLKSLQSLITKEEIFQPLNKEIWDIFEAEINDFETKKLEISVINENIVNFEKLLKSHETNVKKNVIKRETSIEEKFQLQLDKIQREKRDLKEKFDAVRTRNTKMEKNMDELRNEIKKIKTESASASSNDRDELEKLRIIVDELQKENAKFRINELEMKNINLSNENDEISRKQSDATKDVVIEELKKEILSLRARETSENREKEMEERMKQVHAEYGLKLEKMKQKMKAAYNEQVSKLNQEQEKRLNEKMETMRRQMEQQCRKYTDDIVKYKAHITDLSSRYWDVGEKLLAETQQRQSAVYQLEQLTGNRLQQREAIAESKTVSATSSSRLKTASLDRREFGMDRGVRELTSRPTHHTVEVIEEETMLTTRRHSVKSIQALGNAFSAEDEEGEVFDNVYLADMKEGQFPKTALDLDRLSELRMRNSMCKPHLKSSYAVETHFQPVNLTEDDIKNGLTSDDVFNDSLSQSLLPGQKPKKRDRTQTSYKRPGPPTPSKNGGRLSLQGAELKSPNSRVLREKNVERRTTATPRRLKDLFGTSSSKRQDENSAGTPKGRRLSNIFRKQRTERN